MSYLYLNRDSYKYHITFNSINVERFMCLNEMSEEILCIGTDSNFITRYIQKIKYILINIDYNNLNDFIEKMKKYRDPKLFNKSNPFDENKFNISKNIFDYYQSIFNSNQLYQNKRFDYYISYEIRNKHCEHICYQDNKHNIGLQKFNFCGLCQQKFIYGPLCTKVHCYNCKGHHETQYCKSRYDQKYRKRRNHVKNKFTRMKD